MACSISGKLLLATGYVLVFGWALVFAIDDGIQRAPAMGWNSWNNFGCNINETTILNQAKAMAAKRTTANWEGKYISMKDVGYQFVNLDDCWEGSRSGNGIIDYEHTLFPHGMSWLCDTIRKLGLIPGLYTSAGTATCQGRPAQYGNDWNDAFTYAKWGFQYLKEDWCNVPSQYNNKQGAIDLYTKSYQALRKAADSVYALKLFPGEKGPRYFTFSLCNWGNYQSWTYGAQCGHSARMSGDISADWGSVIGIIDECIDNQVYKYNVKGFFNDPDMLEVGNGLSQSENQAHFDLWCIQQAPLLSGNNLATQSNATFFVLTNREVIAVNQDSLNWCGRRVKVSGNLELWYKRCFTRTDSGVLVTDSTKMDKSVIVLNRGTSTASYTIARTDPLELGNSTFAVRDLWQHKIIDTITTADNLTVSVAGHGTTHLRFSLLSSVGIDSGKPLTFSNNQLTNGIQVRRMAEGLEISFPFSGFVSILDIQGKNVASFAEARAGCWYNVPCKSLGRGTFIIKSSIKSGIFAKTIALGR